jgi:hypothetical protein
MRAALGVSALEGVGLRRRWGGAVAGAKELDRVGDDVDCLALGTTSPRLAVRA